MAAPGDQDETTAFRPRFGADGLLPVIAQDEDGTVLMLAYADEEALRLTLRTGEAHYWSRSRQEIWRKGATSGDTQAVSAVLVDCDQDTLLYRVRRRGPACHTGRQSCFYRELAPQGPDGTVQLEFTEPR
jgi:phosphoribosyl-AMP cyclohydrolase